MQNVSIMSRIYDLKFTVLAHFVHSKPFSHEDLSLFYPRFPEECMPRENVRSSIQTDDCVRNH